MTTMTDQQQVMMQQLLDRLERLPEMPNVAIQVNKLLDDPETDAADLADVIMMDPALTAQVLKICNSAQYGFSRRIATIKEAVAILGIKVLKQVIFTILSHSLLNKKIEGYGLEKGQLWENAVTCGVYARHIAKHEKLLDPDVAFVAALLRDIGKIALECKTKDYIPALQQICSAKQIAFTQAEEEVMGINHSLLGYHLAERWRLPDSLINVILFHHRPSQMPPKVAPEDAKLVSIVHLADSMTMISGVGLGVDGLMYPLDPAIFNHLSYAQDNAALETLYIELLELQGEIAEMVKAL